jgi:hypothetical protein
MTTPATPLLTMNGSAATKPRRMAAGVKTDACEAGGINS